MTLTQARARLHAFEAKMSRPVEFYARHQQAWLDLAVRITLATIEHACPADADPNAWRRHAEGIAAAVTAEVFTGEMAGILFRARDDSQPLIFPEESGEVDRSGAQTGLNIADIERWVAAGRAGTEGGKKLKLGRGEMDFGRSDLQIAWRVFNAIQHQRQNWDRLLGHIADFTGSQFKPATDKMGADLERVWETMLAPVIVADWHAWVGEQAAALNG